MSDALATLRSALSPKAGMKRIPFALQSYQHPSPALSSKRLMNLFAEQEPADARVAAALVPTSGLTLDTVFGPLPPGPILAMNSDEPGRLYVASGSEFYRLSATEAGSTRDDLGSIGVPDTDVLVDYARFVTIAVGPTACVVCVPPRAYTCDHNGALNQITGDFPGSATVSYLDGYFIFTAYGDTAQFFISGLLDPSAFDALDFAFSDALPNVIRGSIAFRGDIWLMGDSGVEVWYDSGDQDFPFRRQSGGVIQVGVAAPKSVARGDDSLLWVGRDSIVYQTSGYHALRISDHALETIIQANSPYSAKNGMVHTQAGHTFYSFEIANRTFAYDFVTKVWGERSSTENGNGPWLPLAGGFIGERYLLGDSTGPNLYTLDPTSGLENGVAVIRQAVLPPLWGGTSRAFCNRLEVEMEVGSASSPGDVLLEWSDDGGITWTGSRTMNTGALGQTRKRVYTTRLGSFHQRVFRLTCHGRTTMYGVDCDITPGVGG